MASTVISIPNGDVVALKQKKFQFSFRSFVSLFKEKIQKRSSDDTKKLIHSIKVGIALVLVSLLYLLNPLYKKAGENAMWAIMTVVVVFEFFAGATLSKGINRGIGTILGGSLGCMAAVFAQEVGGVGNVGNAVIVGTSVFIFGAAATHFRMVPSIKKRYDYGVMIFLLTFNLVVVSGLRATGVMELARERLSTIGMGFGVSIFTSLLIFPMWASDEFHYSTASKFENLASAIEGCLEEYFKVVSEKENQPSASFKSCKLVLHSKSKDESLANFARWEPWHGKFGFSHPWDKYQEIGEVLRELAATIISLKGCLQSPRQASSTLRQSIKEPCEAVGSSLAWTLRELGDSIMEMRRCLPKALILPKLQSTRQEIGLVISPSKLATIEGGEGLAISSFVFLLKEMVEKVGELAKEVEELGELAEFPDKMLAGGHYNENSSINLCCT
ncbi:hypothetical protein L1049_003860 [Liquidambar formosana]|uniref:Aluminum-activated malate transporter n=1 Tax=Liquidambar formosana TaxID=63359 RepID=A0AAP0RRE1_LIQFO